MALTKGRQGMTKALKRADRLRGMVTNRKRDKRSQRASYHSQFNKAKGQPPMDWDRCGFTKPKPKPTE